MSSWPHTLASILPMPETGGSNSARTVCISQKKGTGHLPKICPAPFILLQLCRIIKVLYDMTDTSYIHTGSVRDVLNGEDRIASEPTAEIGELNINRPLNDIIREIILMLLAQEGMTQSKAAEQLGICRTTLWRYLRKQP